MSPREREILELVAQGLTNAQVARMLWISPGTVRKHLENAYEKLDVHTRTGAVAALLTYAQGNTGNVFPQQTSWSVSGSNR